MLELIEERTMPAIFKNARGSSCGSTYKDKLGNTEVWFIVHLVSYEKPRHYYHILVVFDVDMNLLRYSSPFKFEGECIEYCIGLIVEEERVIIPYSTMDRTTKLALYSKNYIDSKMVYIVKNKNYFLADDGHKLISNIPSRFSNYFDWIFTYNTILKKTDFPKTIYVKTDYLPRFVEYLSLLNNKFTLITGTSDYSPSVNFRKEYDEILANPFLIKWYMSNCLSVHEKIIAYPGGLCHNEISDDVLLTLRNRCIKNKGNKILCIWRERDFNVCGNEFITREQTKKFIQLYPDIFDFIEPKLDVVDFYKLLAEYKFVLCPVGNGVDPCPKLFEGIILNTIPIIIRTTNTEDIYNDMPVLLVNKFEEILSFDNLGDIYDSYNSLLNTDNTLYKLTCEYWYNKIIQNE